MPKLQKDFPNDRSGELFNFLLEKFKLSNDKQLSDKIGLSRPVISTVRTGKHPITGASLVQIHERTGVSIKRMRELIGDAERGAPKPTSDETPA